MTSSLRIAIVAPEAVPPVEGGAERLWRALRDGLVAAGHQAEIITLPFPETTLDDVLAGYQAFRALDVSAYDVVVSGKYPAWMVEHPCQVVYMLHPLRGLADTYPTHLDAAIDPSTAERLDALRSIDDIDELLVAARSFHDALDASDPLLAHPSPFGRAVVRRLDELAFAGDRIRHFAAISDEVARRPGCFPTDRAVQVAHPVSDVPIESTEDTVDGSPEPSGAGGPTFFTASRHDAPKRIDLIIRAFRRLTDTNNDRQLSLVIAGDGPERDNLEREAGGNERIEFLGRVSEAELAARYRSADVTVFLPLQEDFGYVSLESMLAGTPVLSTTDAGGANELLDHDAVGGVVVEPTIEALAAAMDQLADDPFRRWQLGTNGRRRANSITWDPLVASIEMAAEATSTRPRAVMVSTFGIEPAVGGGQRRVRHLARALARRADVTVVALAGGGDGGDVKARRRVIEPGITLVEVPRSHEHRAAEAEITRVAGFPIDDITCGRLWPSTPAFAGELAGLAAGADVVIASHPFLAPAIEATLASVDSEDRPIAVVYDSHNAETPFKTAMLTEANTSDEARSWLVDAVTEAETTAVRLAAHVTACTDDDLAAVMALAPASRSDGPNGSPATSVVPNGVDTNAMPLRTDPEHRAARAEALALLGFPTDDDRPLAVFVGSWHPPNIDAARLIIELAGSESGTGALFGLAGSHTIQFDAGQLPPNVALLPAFAEESLWPLLAGADVAMNPMVSGGGSNLKLYDYLSVGVPVLTTPTGARGLDQPDHVVTIAEPTVDALAAALHRVLGRPNGEAAAMARAGRAVAEEADWRLLGTRWAGDVLTCIPGRAAQGPERPWPAVTRPTVAPTTPPAPDPTIELMNRIAIAALDPAPPVEMTAMNPNLRESLKAMRANRHAGRELPHDARLKLPKQALIRAGHAITNEQLVFNEATIGVVDQLSEQVTDLSEQVARLSEQVTDLERRLGDS